ncbi:MAG: DUF3419 family protein [Candidatus Melainabacteria bacterium]|nr:DUF3419 family protein [Candidatus Melainabacteria bacterium]
MQTLERSWVRSWVERACRAPVGFSQVREDSLVDIALAELCGSDLNGAIIASGGCTAAALSASGRFARLALVDQNPAQIALAKLKLWLLDNCKTEERLALLGHLDMPAGKRGRSMETILSELNLPHDVLGDLDGTDLAGRGADYCGRYEILFEALRAELAKDDADLDGAFAATMTPANLLSVFGPDAVRNPVRPFHEHFADRTRRALGLYKRNSNPYLCQMLDGRFADGALYPWLTMEAPETSPSLSFTTGTMSDFLSGQVSSSLHFLHLSNILDWLDSEAAESLLRKAAAALVPGGLLIVRQLNSSLYIRIFREGLAWLPELSENLLAAERSFFYRDLHVGIRL